jgi:hypothetical protein
VPVTLTASTTNGSNTYFQDWASPACDGPGKTCTENANASPSVTATFGSYATSGNLMFATSVTTYTANLGQSASYFDGECNRLASLAGINNADAPNGALYMAWLSTSAVDTAAARLGTSFRGWRRLDGAILADDTASWLSLTSPKFMNAVSFDESGALVTTSLTAMTGTLADGSLGSNCSNLTGAGSINGGDVRSGAVGFTNYNTYACSGSYRLLCVMRKNSAALTPPAAPAGAKHIALSNTLFTPAVGANPDTACTAGYRALIARYNAATMLGTNARSVLNMAATYVRPDNVVIGTGAQIASFGLLSGWWQHQDGTYVANRATTGTTWIGTWSGTATSANTCGDWSGTGSLPGIGTAVHTTSWAVSNGSSGSCAVGRPVICIEQ